MATVVYRKKGLYYKKYGYKIECWSDQDKISEYVKNNFEFDDYRIVYYQGIYFKNEADFEKTYNKFKYLNLGVIYRPAPGYENLIGEPKISALWHSRFPFRIKLDTQYITNTKGYKIFNDVSAWCGANLDGPHHASYPSIFVMTKLDVIAIKMRFAQHIKITDQRLNSKKSKKMLEERIKDAQNDLKLFLDSE